MACDSEKFQKHVYTVKHFIAYISIMMFLEFLRGVVEKVSCSLKTGEWTSFTHPHLRKCGSDWSSNSASYQADFIIP